ncbi:hypothetical protein GCM10028818_35450 [Spirosoma horti]
MEQPLYQNPLVATDFPDPSVLLVSREGYYAYATHDQFSPTQANILLRRSPDLIHWSEATGALASPPIWAQQCQRFWCPQVVYVNGQYRLYYAAESDANDGMHLALALSDTPDNFVDIGVPLSGSNGSYAMIDPCFFADPQTGKHYLYYGSAHEPIRAIELGPDGHTFISEPVDVLFPRPGVPFETLREGTFVTYDPAWKRYYLWVSGDNTWAPNGYAVSVYWSADPVRGFIPIPEPHIILKANEHWDSPGQVCVLTDEAGVDWLIYHAVDTTDRYIPGTNIFLRKMCLDRITYSSEGWPSIASRSPSFSPQASPTVRPAVTKGL